EVADHGRAEVVEVQGQFVRLAAPVRHPASAAAPSAVSRLSVRRSSRNSHSRPTLPATAWLRANGRELSGALRALRTPTAPAGASTPASGSAASRRHVARDRPAAARHPAHVPCARPVTAFVEPSLKGAAPGSRYQFERLGYFCVDKDTTPQKPV